VKGLGVKAYIEIIRPSIVAMAAFGTFIGAFIAGAGVSQMLCLSLAAALIAGAGIVLNDYYDCEIDRINAPHRPLPSGRIKKSSAIAYALVLFAAGILLSSFVNAYCISLAAINTLLEFLYARNFKRIAIVGNAVDSWFAASTLIFGGLATLNLGAIWILSVIAFFANMGREIYGDIEDVKGDRALGLKTLPVVTSVEIAEFVARFFIILSVILSPVPYLLGIFGAKYLFFIGVADAVFIYSLFQPPKTNQKLTKLAMVIALFGFLAAGL